MTKKSIARGAALSALGYGAFEILGGITEAGADDEDQVEHKMRRILILSTFCRRIF